MAPLRAVVAGCVLFAACCVVGQTGRTPTASHRIVRDPPLTVEAAAVFRLAPEDVAAIRNPPTSVKPRVTSVRASRAATAPRQVRAQIASAPLADGDGSCGSWGYKSRARSDECWGPYLAQWSDWSVPRMLAILYCESKGNPWVVNASNHVGLLQIKNSHTKGDGPGNIAHAHAMFQRSGTRPWAQCGG